MRQKYLETMFTPRVLEAQQHYYGQARNLGPASEAAVLGPEEIAFIAARDSFYLASVSETGWPYLQHRGGRAGFLKVVSPTELAFADYKGNRQLLSTGNLAGNDRVSLFLMDYPARERLKLIGHATILDAAEAPELVRNVTDPESARVTERVFRIRVVGFDWNCSQYITPRYTADEVNVLAASLKQVECPEYCCSSDRIL